MLSRFLAWIGWSSAPQPPQGTKRPFRPHSATGHLFDKRPAPPPAKPRSSAGSSEDFNPYNTGKFDRSASWERISKNQR